MLRKHSLAWLTGMVCLATLPAAARESGPASKPTTWAETATVEEIVTKIRADEAWIWDATGFLMRSEGRWVRTPEAIQVKLAELKRKWPEENFDDPRTRLVFWDLQPEIKEQLLLAWDERRLARSHAMVGIWSEHQIFDGEQFLVHHQEHYERGREYYALDRSPHRFISESALADYASGRVTYPDPWWVETDEDSRAYMEPPIAMYRDEGIQERKGQRYRVVTYYTGRPDREHWINVETGRIEYLKTWFVPNPGREKMEEFETAAGPLMIELLVEELFNEERFKGLAKEILESLGRRPDWVKDFFQRLEREVQRLVREEKKLDFQKHFFELWLDSLKVEGFLAEHEDEARAWVVQRQEAEPDLFERLQAKVHSRLEDQNPLTPRPFVEHVFKDWREVAPGRFFPFEQGYTMWFHDFENVGRVSFIRPIRVTELAVGRLQPDELFAMEMKEGVQVHDWGHEPPLHYKYKKDFTPEEWSQILAEAEEQAKDKRESEDQQQALVGKPAPDLVAQKWLNSEPLDWPQLKGKLVIVDFFAEWCVPCRNDLPKMADWHKNRVADDLVVLGVHTPGSDEAKIRKLMEQHELHYPIAVDVPTEEGGYWGKTFAAYKVSAIPHAVLVDETGKVAVDGQLNEVMNEAIRRMNAKGDR